MSLRSCNSQDRLGVICRHLNTGNNSISLEPIQSKVAFSSRNDQQTHNFIYTLSNNKLDTSQRQFYEENGFLVVRDLVPHHLIDRWHLRFLDLIEDRVSTGGMTKMKDVSLKNREMLPAELVVNKIQDFVWDPVLSEFCMLPQITDYVECFTGNNIMAMHTMLINKPPDPGTGTSRHPIHQDLHYFPFRPADRIVAAWTAMEKIDTSNGCLFVVPGSHKGKLEVHEYPEWEKGVNKMYHGVRGFDHLPKKMLSMNKGDTVFFHPLLLHGSGDNRTQKFRKAISCHYASSECYYIDVIGTSQENIAKEVQQLINKRGIDDMDYKAVWKLRSRLVKGREVTL